MDFIYYISRDFVHYSALLLLLGAIPIIIIKLAKPGLIPKPIKFFGNRKNTMISSVVSIIVLVGLIAATGPVNFEAFNIEKNSADRQPDSKQANYFQAEQKQPLEKKLQRQAAAIKFKTEEKPTKNIPPGQKKITQKGMNGKKIMTYEVNYKDGQEVSRQLKAESVIKEPIKQIVLVSDKPSSGSKKYKTSKESKGHCREFFRSLRQDNEIKDYLGFC